MPQPKSFGYFANDIATWFINATDREAGDAITHLKVQKLVYYAQGWALSLLGRPLFDEQLEAWAHGPVARSVWEKFKNSSFEALEPQPIRRGFKFDPSVEKLLKEINDKYGIFSAKKLEALTHQESPWKNARVGLSPQEKSSNKLKRSDMKACFDAMRA